MFHDDHEHDDTDDAAEMMADVEAARDAVLEAVADALEAGDLDTSDDVRAAAARLNAIPADVRALHTAASMGERLVAVLTAAGVRFADDDGAAGQIGTAVYAAWRFAREHDGEDDEAAFLAAVAIADTIEHAIEHADGQPVSVRDMLGR